MGTYRDAPRACPSCATPMDVVSLDGSRSNVEAAIDVCASCRGAFFEFFDGEPSAISRALPRRPPGRASARTPKGALMCPDCAAPMVRKAYLGNGPELARCEQCMAAFVTPDEMQVLAQLSLEADAKDGAPAPSWTARAWQWLRRAEASATRDETPDHATVTLPPFDQSAAPDSTPSPSAAATSAPSAETAAELWREVDRLVALMREHGDAAGSAYPADEPLRLVVGPSRYDLVVDEPGGTYAWRSATTRDALLFRLLRERARAQAAASTPERNDRDHRRIIFPGTIARLRKIDARWAEREAAEQAKELATDPYDDAKRQRLALFKQLRAKKGISEWEANRDADERFPRPAKSR
jgi:Zn-finger nucleic acid-binding protein